MKTIKVKALSVNACFQGRRFKTKHYKAYELQIKSLLPKIDVPKGQLMITFHFGFSSKLSDIDNPVKPFMDILQKQYGFNDNQVYEMRLTKEIVNKGDEFIEFDIKPI